MSEPKNLREALKGELTEEELEDLGRSFDIVGDIAVIKIPDSLLNKKHVIGEALLDIHPNLNTVLRQTSPVEGEFRTRDLEVISGEQKTVTEHKENGCILKADLNKVYFSPRLAHERMRIAKKVESGEIVINMFAGVGSYSIIMGKHAKPKKVYSIDKNPETIKYMKYNARVNKISDIVIPIKGDARRVIKSKLSDKGDRVLMPLPEFGRDFFDSALEALKPEGGVIHFYDYGEKPSPFEAPLKFVKDAASPRKVELLESRKVRSYAPNLYHVVLDLRID
ncbi:MAG: class I SAM-dependent methyltransferase family protein [Hadesarchaea archaeon]|nr:class I SAM-dependent methyltransferase family protein [Hadesarchaea archaeon]